MTSALHLHFAELSIKCLEQSAVLLGKVVQLSQVPSTEYQVTKNRVLGLLHSKRRLDGVAEPEWRRPRWTQIGTRARPAFDHQSNLDKEQIQF